MAIVFWFVIGEEVRMLRGASSVLCVAISFIAGCDNQTKTSVELPIAQKLDDSIPEITSESEVDGFVDLVFRLTAHETRADGSQQIRARGLHKGEQVGFEIVLSNSWKKRSAD